MSYPGWDQDRFNHFQRNLPANRVAEDNRALREVFNAGRKHKRFAQGLEWALDHGMRCFVDRKGAVSDDAYHVPHTGVIAIAEKTLKDPHHAKIAVAHECRHLWQDYYGLGRAQGVGVVAEYINIAADEADAMAFEGLDDEDLWEGMTSWFSSPRAQGYGVRLATAVAREQGLLGVTVKGIQPYEFGIIGAPRLPALPLREKIMGLNSDYTGKPYFNAAAAPDFISGMMDFNRAARFYDDTRDEPHPLVQEVLWAQMATSFRF